MSGHNRFKPPKKSAYSHEGEIKTGTRCNGGTRYNLRPVCNSQTMDDVVLS